MEQDALDNITVYPDMDRSSGEPVMEVAFKNALVRRGVDQETPAYLADKLAEELEAHETKVFCDKGTPVYSKDMVAWGVRQKARMDAQKLFGLYPADRHEVELNAVTLQALLAVLPVDIEAKAREKLVKMAKERSATG